MTNLHLTLTDGSFPSKNGAQPHQDDPTTKTKANDPFTQWRVRAGSFAFRIGCDFALLTFSINEPLADQNWDSAKGHTPIEDMTFGSPPTKPKIEGVPYANPMRLTDPIAISHLVVTIDSADEPDDPDDSKAMAHEPHGWQVTPIVKQVPLALWKQYSSDEDPTQGGGNQIGTMLDGSKPTVALCMGLEIRAPKPILSVDKIPKFDVEDATSKDVNADANDDPALVITPPIEMGHQPTSVKYDTTNSDPSVRKAAAQKAWQDTANLWLNAPGVQKKDGVSGLQSLVDECASFLGWDQPNAEQIALLGYLDVQSWKTATPWKIDAAVPVGVVDDGFGGGEYYLALPMLTG
jgi:hypothetical protein